MFAQNERKQRWLDFACQKVRINYRSIIVRCRNTKLQFFLVICILLLFVVWSSGNQIHVREQELSLFGLASAKLSDAQKFMAEARDLLKQDLNNARQEKSAIEEITKTLNEVHFASTIKLNVGGKIYETTLDHS